MKLSQPWLACAVGGLILAGVIIDRALHQIPPADAYPYHARVRAVSDSMPQVLGDWNSEEVPVPTAAQKLLRSNVIISRQYTNKKTGDKATFLLVQCSDARDLSGHYPPICYPNAGYTLAATTPPDDPHAAMDRDIGDLYKGGTFYKFTQDTLQGTRAMWVFNLMVLPNGKTSPDMSGVYDIARRRSMRYFGAAEIQVITNVGMPETDRSRAISTLLAGAQPLIETIRSGVVQ